MQRYIPRKFTLLTICMLFCCSLWAQEYNDEAASDTIDINENIAESDEEENIIDNLELFIVTDSSAIAYNMPRSALDGVIMDEDSIVFDLPVGMSMNIDSLLNSWYARNLLKSLDCDSHDVSPRVFSDSVYAQRLYAMPTIMNMPYNSVVRQYIDRYSTKNRSLVSYALGISHFYMPIIEDAIDRYEMPHELKYLPIVESAMKPKAVSPAGAKGLWQFMFGTSKLYGLKSNNYIEERFDPIKSTDAAMRYLRDLYKTFGSWDLALAAYNCGPGRVKKAILRSGKKDFWGIYRYLPKETRGYVPAFIAANYIMTYHEEHGICPMEPNVPITTDTLHITRNLHFAQIADICNVPLEEIRAINPQYVRDIIPGNNEPCVIRLTNETITRFIGVGDSIYIHDEEKYFPKDKVDKMLKEAKENNEWGSGGVIRHKIRSGENLGSIARKYRVKVSQLKKWNNLKNSNIRAGRYLKIYK